MKEMGNVFILGDSYSTFEGFIPDGYARYYDNEGPNYIRKNPDMKLGDNDVCEVFQTGWYNLVKENGELIRNCSWSGSTICHTGYDGNDFSDFSFVTRIKRLIGEGYFEKNRIDTFFLFGGTNDSWSDAPLGEKIFENWTEENLYNVLPAFSYLINLLVSVLPNAKIYCIINTELKEEITSFYKLVCKNSGVNVICLKDIEKICGHPTVKGMKQIKEQVENYIKRN